jgi:hypothetical protein
MKKKESKKLPFTEIIGKSFNPSIVLARRFLGDGTIIYKITKNGIVVWSKEFTHDSEKCWEAFDAFIVDSHVQKLS